MQVNTNGVLTFRNPDPFSLFIPRPFPLDSPSHIIALYWDVHGSAGSIYYRISENGLFLDEVGTNISDAFSTTFMPSSLFIATWDGVPRFSSFFPVS